MVINQLQGKKAQSLGVMFERMFDMRCQHMGITATRFPDGCRVIGKNRTIRVKTPWDWIVSFNGKVAFLDTKTSYGSFPHSKIEEHQVLEMVHHEAAGNGNVAAGYVVWLRERDIIFFVPASTLIDLMKCRGSIGHESKHIVILGSSVAFDPIGMFTMKPEGKYGTS